MASNSIRHEMIKDIPFCALDLETTQVPNTPGALAITEIGAQRFRGDKLTAPAFNRLVNPCCPIRPFDTRVSGISDQVVAEEPTFLELKDEFLSYVQGHVVVAHNVPFDRRALESQCARDDVSLPDFLYVDTLAILRRTVKLRRYSLEAVAQHFGLQCPALHRAGSDCILVINLFWELTELLKSEHGVTFLDELYEFVNPPRPPAKRQGNLFE